MGLKRYLLFVSPRYYPSGGMEDFVGDHDSLKGAMQGYTDHLAKEDPVYPEAHIFDSQERRIILERNCEDGDWEKPDAFDGRVR